MVESHKPILHRCQLALLDVEKERKKQASVPPHSLAWQPAHLGSAKTRVLSGILHRHFVVIITLSITRRVLVILPPLSIAHLEICVI